MRDRKAGWLILVGGCQAGLGLLGFWTYVAYFESQQIDSSMYGYIFAYFSAVAALSCIGQEWIEKRIGDLRSHILLWLCCIFGFAVPLVLPGVLGIAIFGLLLSFVRGYGNSYLNSALDAETDSDYKATVFSLSSMVGRLLYVTFTLIVGLDAKTEQILTIWSCFVVISIISAITLGLAALKLKRQEAIVAA